MFPDLVQLFDTIEIPAGELGAGRFNVRNVQGNPACLLGRDASGGPVLLVNADESQPGTSAPYILESLCVIHLVRCRLQAPEQQVTERALSIIHCTSSDRSIQEYFLRCLHPIIAALPARPSRDDVANAIERLTELFRKMSSPPQKTILGLWAELFVIDRSSNPARLIDAWHAIPEERFDFAEGNQRLEVKATSSPLRVHHFSLEQLRPIGLQRCLIVSLLVEQTVAGMSVADLVDRIRNRSVDNEHLIRLDSVVAQTVGSEWRNLHLIRFNADQAIDSVRYVRSEDIPAVQTPVPSTVSSVHFRVDLSSLVPEPATQEANEDGLFGAAIPIHPIVEAVHA